MGLLAASCVGLLAACVLCASASAQPADTLFLDGRIVTLDQARPAAEALAVRGERIIAVGRSAGLRRLAGPGTRIVDLRGRTVIPGLVDSHIHAIRAGLTHSTEVHWIGVRSLAQALERLREASRRSPKGSWLVVAGGWTERQFAEGRRPTQSEVAAAAPDHSVYVQQLYGAVLLTPGAYEALGIAGDADLAGRLRVERDDAGRPTGWLAGDARSITDLYDRLPRPGVEQMKAGTRAFFRVLNALGITGVIDPGGYNLSIADYQPLFQLWRERSLTLRVAYSVCAPRPGTELEDLQGLTEAMPMGFGDGWLRFNGIGENVTWGMYNNDSPGSAQKDALARVLRWAAARGLTATFHWNNDRSVHHLLEVLERVHRDTPLAALRWSIAHLHDASPGSLVRMKAMGVGWLVQDAFYFRGEAFIAQRGHQGARAAPPIASALHMGLAVGAGTDAHRVMSYNPFVSLQWMLDGRTVGGTPTRSAGELPTREQALRLYTQGSAWFAFDEVRRGTLAPGRLADLAVLSRDYLHVPTGEIAGIDSLLTMVGGRIVYGAGPYSKFEERIPE